MNIQQSSETVNLASASQMETKHAGFSLASSLLSRQPLILLKGELGAGKTTFVQGLAEGLGIHKTVTSPTYALENRYGDVLLHSDLYRLDASEALKIVEESEDFPGVRAIEWSDRTTLSGCIAVHISESSATERNISITFNDCSWPSREQIDTWRGEYKLPDHISEHCDVVGNVAKRCAQELLQRGIVCRPSALQHAGWLHDLLRFTDFHPAAGPHDPEEHSVWCHIREQYGIRHEEACARLLEEHGYRELALIIRPHGLRDIDHPEQFTTIEQKILFYSDKRVLGGKIVSVSERFEDFAKRYCAGKHTAQHARWQRKTEELEKELFGESLPC